MMLRLTVIALMFAAAIPALAQDMTAAQAERGSATAYAGRIDEGFPDRVTSGLAQFLAKQDTIFLATATKDSAPYIQHRGGLIGLAKVLDDKTPDFADYKGNRQYITLANLSENDRAYMFPLDPARRQRIKLWGHARRRKRSGAER